MKNVKFTFIDLFAGIGGFRKAMADNGGECLYFSEINSDAINTYCVNSNEPVEKNLGDITKIKSLPSHNLLTAGVPCQSWSIAGKNLGFDDDRGQLWNDTIFLLNQSRPDAFIFENVKGLVDPRNKKALTYILERIKEAGYFAKYYVLNSFDYGVPQNRIRIYIIGFKDPKVAEAFRLPKPIDDKVKLADILNDFTEKIEEEDIQLPRDLFGNIITQKSMSLSTSNGLNDYFLFNDLRNGHSTIHSWDIKETTERQKEICYLLLKNRRKSAYGCLDGNPLSLNHFQGLDRSISKNELEELVDLEILKKVDYAFKINPDKLENLEEEEQILLEKCKGDILVIDELKTSRELKLKKISITKAIEKLLEKEVLELFESRYDFKNTKISTGLYGVNRIFLPSSNIFPTLVASDTNDFVTTQIIKAKNETEHKKNFIDKVYKKENYRRITKEEACLIQGFPKDYILPDSRARWMKLIGNSVSVPVIDILVKAIIETGVFDKIEIEKQHEVTTKKKASTQQAFGSMASEVVN
jgi:DNA (cytosine-5)-methyltransferase 1